MRLRGRTAVVTGASMGIGAETTRKLASRGVTVYAVARSEDRLDALARDSDRIRPLVADVTVEADRERIASSTGEVDILVNNAGMGALVLIEHQPIEDIRHLFELNVISMIDLSQRFMVGMLERRRGHICNIGSVISHVATPPLSIYASTKFAVAGFSDGLRRELIGRGVHVSLIQPGPAKTGFWDRSAGGDRSDVDERSGTGISSSMVGSAVVRAIARDRIPGYATVGVPRWMGLARVLDVPGVSYMVDVARLFVSNGGQLGR